MIFPGSRDCVLSGACRSDHLYVSTRLCVNTSTYCTAWDFAGDDEICKVHLYRDHFENACLRYTATMSCVCLGVSSAVWRVAVTISLCQRSRARRRVVYRFIRYEGSGRHVSVVVSVWCGLNVAPATAEGVMKVDARVQRAIQPCSTVVPGLLPSLLCFFNLACASKVCPSPQRCSMFMIHTPHNDGLAYVHLEVPPLPGGENGAVWAYLGGVQVVGWNVSSGGELLYGFPPSKRCEGQFTLHENL